MGSRGDDELGTVPAEAGDGKVCAEGPQGRQQSAGELCAEPQREREGPLARGAHGAVWEATSEDGGEQEDHEELQWEVANFVAGAEQRVMEKIGMVVEDTKKRLDSKVDKMECLQNQDGQGVPMAVS